MSGGGATCELDDELQQKLCECIEPSYGLLDQLLALRVINRRQLKDIQADRSAEGKNEKLLELMSGKSEEHWKNLKIALADRTDQQHVVNYMDAAGGWIVIDKFPML